MAKRQLVALFYLYSWCLVTVSALWLFLTVLWVGLQCVILVISDDHTILHTSNTYVGQQVINI